MKDLLLLTNYRRNTHILGINCKQITHRLGIDSMLHTESVNGLHISTVQTARPCVELVPRPQTVCMTRVQTKQSCGWLVYELQDRVYDFYIYGNAMCAIGVHTAGTVCMACVYTTGGVCMAGVHNISTPTARPCV